MNDPGVVEQAAINEPQFAQEIDYTVIRRNLEKAGVDAQASPVVPILEDKLGIKFPFVPYEIEYNNKNRDGLLKYARNAAERGWGLPAMLSRFNGLSRNVITMEKMFDNLNGFDMPAVGFAMAEYGFYVYKPVADEMSMMLTRLHEAMHLYTRQKFPEFLVWTKNNNGEYMPTDSKIPSIVDEGVSRWTEVYVGSGLTNYPEFRVNLTDGSSSVIDKIAQYSAHTELYELIHSKVPPLKKLKDVLGLSRISNVSPYVATYGLGLDYVGKAMSFFVEEKGKSIAEAINIILRQQPQNLDQIKDPLPFLQSLTVNSNITST